MNCDKFAVRHLATKFQIWIRFAHKILKKTQADLKHYYVNKEINCYNFINYVNFLTNVASHHGSSVRSMDSH